MELQQAPGTMEYSLRALDICSNLYILMCMTSVQTWSETDLFNALDHYEAELRNSGKTRNTINTYVQHPERFIKWLVANYRETSGASEPRQEVVSPSGRTSTYEPLHDYLVASSDSILPMSFAEVERILGRGLPNSARRYPAWWANEQSGTHAHAHSWMDAGWSTRRVDINAATVEFYRS